MEEAMEDDDICIIRCCSQPMVTNVVVCSWIFLLDIRTGLPVQKNRTLTCSSDKKRVTLAMFFARNGFNDIMCASLPKKMLFAKFCRIFVITISPRRRVMLLSPLGTSISIISGVTTAGEMNLRVLRILTTQRVACCYRKKIKAPMAANLDSGHTPELKYK